MIFHSHDSDDVCLPSTTFFPNKNFINAMFVDPGIKNCGIRIVHLDIDNLKIETMFMGRLSFYDNRNLIKGIERTVIVLKEIEHLIKFCHYIVIETQMGPKTRGFNPQNYRFAQHLISTFIMMTRNTLFKPIIVEIPSSLKITGIGGPKLKNERDRKEWCKKKSRDILLSRGDEFGLKVLEMYMPKIDDIADTVCYDEGWWDYMTNHPIIPRPKNWKIFIEK